MSPFSSEDEDVVRLGSDMMVGEGASGGGWTRRKSEETQHVETQDWARGGENGAKRDRAPERGAGTIA